MLFQTEFIADELGYRPVGEHIHPAFVQVYLQLTASQDEFKTFSISDGEAGEAIGGEKEGRVQGKASERWGSRSKRRQGVWQEEALKRFSTP